jgi:hypothetical protein
VFRTACTQLFVLLCRSLYHVWVFLAFVLGDFCEKKISMCYVVVVGDGVRLKVFPNADDEKLKTYGYRRNRHLNGPLS